MQVRKSPNRPAKSSIQITEFPLKLGAKVYLISYSPFSDDVNCYIMVEENLFKNLLHGNSQLNQPDKNVLSSIHKKIIKNGSSLVCPNLECGFIQMFTKSLKCTKLIKRLHHSTFKYEEPIAICNGHYLCHQFRVCLSF